MIIISEIQCPEIWVDKYYFAKKQLLIIMVLCIKQDKQESMHYPHVNTTTITLITS